MAVFKPGDRNYSCWSWSDDLAHDDCNPVKEGMLVGDSLLADGKIGHTSPYLTNQAIPGVLVLDGSTYGRYGSRMLYKCLPSDPLLPAFMIPYSVKTVEFSKRKVNRYVLFRFVEWDDKHPLGSLTHTIGTVDDLNKFYCDRKHFNSLEECFKDGKDIILYGNKVYCALLLISYLTFQKYSIKIMK